MLKLLIKEKKELPTAKYETPGWPYLEADRLGYNRAVEDVHKLINIEGDNP